jgi:uncharacterized membrane protein
MLLYPSLSCHQGGQEISILMSNEPRWAFSFSRRSASLCRINSMKLQTSALPKIKMSQSAYTKIQIEDEYSFIIS